MRRPSSPKGGNRSIERRKKPRGEQRSSSKNSKASTRKAQRLQASETVCYNCGLDLTHDDQQALFVEEDVSLIFCTEKCITEYFTPEINALEKEYFKNLSTSDFSSAEKESLAHLRWITLQEPDEVWREVRPKGHKRFILISKFQPSNTPLWYVCITLFLRGEPSFLYLAFATRDALLVDYYRRGERVEWEKTSAKNTPSPDAPESDSSQNSDRLADAWTEDETAIANLPVHTRSAQDIAEEEYPKYQQQFDKTLEEPHELWSQPLGDEGERHLYHFIRHYPEIEGGIWVVIVARELKQHGQIEILDVFPTRDSSLLEKYRIGEREVIDAEETQAPTRIVH